MKRRVLFAVIAPVSFLIIVSRRPGVILNPQFWAEDGKVWYADAYNRGILYSLFTPEAGYYQTFSRLVAIGSQPLPLSSAPIFFNLTAITAQLIVVLFIVSPRFARIIPSLRWRLAVAFLYVALPHSHEVIANVTNSQWHLALLSLFIIISGPTKETWWRVFDVTVLVVSSLSGPLCLLLLPIALLWSWRSRERWMLLLSVILCTGVAIHASALLTQARPSQAPLGATIEVFFRITGRHLFASAIMGGRAFGSFASRTHLADLLLVLANLGGFVLIAYALLKGSPAIRALILFSGLVFLAALASPAVSPEEPQWQAIAKYDTALRYWFIPNITLFITLVYFASEKSSGWFRYAALTALGASLFGIVTDWKNPPMPDLDFYTYAAEFEKAPPGTVFEIPINPPPHWTMTLVKKPIQ